MNTGENQFAQPVFQPPQQHYGIPYARPISQGNMQISGQADTSDSPNQSLNQNENIPEAKPVILPNILFDNMEVITESDFIDELDEVDDIEDISDLEEISDTDFIDEGLEEK